MAHLSPVHDPTLFHKVNLPPGLHPNNFLGLDISAFFWVSVYKCTLNPTESSLKIVQQKVNFFPKVLKLKSPEAAPPRSEEFGCPGQAHHSIANVQM